MRSLACFLIAYAMIGTTFAQTSEPKEIDSAAKVFIERALKDASDLTPGVDRSAVEKLWEEDGGLQVRKQTRYVYRRCPLIKIEVDFAVSQQDTHFDPSDKVIRVSKPYLEYPIAD